MSWTNWCPFPPPRRRVPPCRYDGGMCRNIRVLYHFDPPTTPDEIRAAIRALLPHADRGKSTQCGIENRSATLGIYAE